MILFMSFAFPFQSSNINDLEGGAGSAAVSFESITQVI